MLFCSMTFIYIFLPILCIIYFFSKNKYHNFILLAASIIFYAWGEPKYLAVMFLSIMINYLGAILIDKFPKYKTYFFIISILGNLGLLFYFKYFNFLIENLTNLFNFNIDPIHVILPLGISFYTFQAMSYLIDVYKGEFKAQKNLYKLALYICLFPQLIAGPIVKYHDIAPQIENREENFDKVTLGIKRFIIGLSKKMLLANNLGIIAEKIFSQQPDSFSPLIGWIGAFTYSMQIYFDFSGYSDMAIGLGLIFGFKFMENFNYPLISKSVSELWKRWHISLSTWFKYYVYIPLGGNRVSKARNIFNILFVFFLIGLWHGASWNFVLWGLLYGIFILFEKATGLYKETDKLVINILKNIYTIIVFVLAIVFFRTEDLNYIYAYLKNMFGLIPVHNIQYTFTYYMDNLDILIFISALLCAFPIFSKMLYINPERRFLKLFVNAWLLVLFILSTAFIASSTYNPFIYFRF
ncbi:MAG: MBOAT family protein [Clostridium sp.]|nr:MBOAT family protein [Clostridium sp.]